MSFLASGRFFTIFPAYALRFPMSNPQIKILPIELPNARVSIGIVTLKNRTLRLRRRNFSWNTCVKPQR